uniref:Citron Rho-interacting kinase n=1 Tax=Ascaris suum TaxID=6253 RepID=F1KQX6_ASCSU
MEAKLKMMRQREDAMLEGLEEVRAALEESQRCHEEHMKECARASAEISAKDAELISLRARLELLTPLRDVQRTNSMDDMLMSQVKSLTAQINEMKTLRDGDERLSDLENRIGALTATNGFLEKQLKEANDREERLKEEVEKWKGEVSELKAEIKRSEERLLECEGSAELTNRYLVDENSKIKQQKAEIRCELIALKREHARLLDAKQRAPDEAELTALREEVTTLKEKLRVAETTQKEENRIKSEPMGTTEIASLLEELATLREKIRVAELQEMQLRTLKAMKGDQCALNKGDNASTQAPRKEYAVKEEGCTECERLKEELVSLKQSQNMESMSALKEKVNQYEQMEKELTEKYNMQKAIAEKLQKELLEAREKNDELRNAMRVLDEQCDKLMELKKRAEAGRKKAVERLTSTNEKLSELRRERDSHQQTDADYKRLLQENERLTKKIDYLSAELRETHTDYREELTKLARQMSETKQKDATENESFAIKIEALETEKRQIEATLRSLQRHVEQCKGECELRAKEVTCLRESQSAVIEENAKLRDGLALAIAKAEKFKEEVEALREMNSMISRDLSKAKDEKSDAVIRADTLQQAFREKERLVAYLQSQVHMRTCNKIKRSSSRSTLISVASESSIVDVEISEYDDRDGGALGRRIVCSVDEGPVRADSASLTRNSGASVSAARTPQPLSSITNRSESSANTCVAPTPSRVGTMKHDIPHRWKTFLLLKQAKCIACYEGLPRVRHAMRCTECGLMAHRVCISNIANTCGLPEQCADYYLDSYTAYATTTMSGWVKLWRSDDTTGNKWRNAWAAITDQRLCFFDNEGLATPTDGGSPFLSVNLDGDHWRLQMQSVLNVSVKGGVSKDSLALLIELRLARSSLFMLAPTVQAKQRWVRALQTATDRRMFVQRRPSASSAANKMLVALDAPLNLTINCSQMLEDWLLIGAQEGLFITQLTSPRVPFIVAGLASVFHMELVSDLEMLIAISGLQRQLVFMHVSDLYDGLKSDRPTVRPTAISNFSGCHLLTVHVNKLNDTRYLCVADPDKINILHFNSRLGVFTPYKSIATSEPATCLLSVADGIAFGADQFYFVDMKTVTARVIVVPGCPSDYPLAAVFISDEELLLAYHNFGVFANVNGNRTRPENVDWNRAPLEFVYAAPTLYIVHNDTLEILQIADYNGPNSRTLLDVRDFYRCHCAHYIGRGRSAKEVLFALSGNDRTEIHSFCGNIEVGL